MYVRTGSGREVVVLLETQRPLTATDRSLVEVFCSRLSVAFDNVILYEQLNDATVRLEERVRERTRALTAANHRLTTQWIRLRRANEFKNEVLGTIAHDLKNPLAVILGRAEMLNELAEMSPAPFDKIREQLGHIRSSATQLTGMVNDLVSDAMMDALDITIRQEPVDIAAMLADVVTANRALAERKRQAIHLVSPPVRWATCDPDRLREAVDNLLEQRHQIQPDRRQDRAVDERRQGIHASSWSRMRAPASRRRISAACSAASSGCRPSRPAAKARPGSASRSSSASSSCTAARSRRKAPGRDAARPS